MNENTDDGFSPIHDDDDILGYPEGNSSPPFMQEFCETEGCYEKPVAVVKVDSLNGNRRCEDCLYEEGVERGWWDE